MYPKSIQKLINLFSKFPTVGPRTAGRFVFYLINKPEKEIEELVATIVALKKLIKLCRFCFNPFEGESQLCEICRNAARNKNLLCVVEKETDLISIEKTKKYKGLYFVFGGSVSKLKKEDLEELRGKELIERLKNPQNFGIEKASFEEIIIATNATTEGETTALYLERLINELNKKTRLDSPSSARRVTRLGRGLPVGGELEYADEETLTSALEGRK